MCQNSHGMCASQISMFYWSNGEGVPAEIPFQIIHQGKEISEHNILNLPDNVIYGITPSGYQARAGTFHPLTLNRFISARGCSSRSQNNAYASRIPFVCRIPTRSIPPSASWPTTSPM